MSDVAETRGPASSALIRDVLTSESVALSAAAPPAGAVRGERVTLREFLRSPIMTQFVSEALGTDLAVDAESPAFSAEDSTATDDDEPSAAAG